MGLNFPFKRAPRDHQRRTFNESAEALNWAVLAEQGTGKTKITLDTASYLYGNGKIDLLVIVAPKGVHRNWITREVPEDVPDELQPMCSYWHIKKKSVNGALVMPEDLFQIHHGMKVFAINYESVISTEGEKFIKRLLNAHRTMLVADEAHWVKTPGAKRTKKLRTLGKHQNVKYKRILTGTPLTNGAMDLYSQYAFLDPEIIGHSTYTSYKNHFAMWQSVKNRKGQRFEKLLCYRNLDQLIEKIKPVSTRIRKEDCLDLPDKIYMPPREVELNAKQRRIYNQLRDDLVAEIEDSTPEQLIMAAIQGDGSNYIKANNVLTQMLRWQQVVGGFATADDGSMTFLGSPKLDVCKDIVDNTDESVIIWAHYQPELEMLFETFKDRAVRYWGDVPDDEREDAIDQFQRGEKQVFIANRAACTGITLTKATLNIYYTNTFDASVRWQSEDRSHRIGQHNKVSYVDLIATNTLDEKIIAALDAKRGLADNVLSHLE